MNVVIKENFKKNFADIWRNELESVGFDTSSIEDKDIPFKYFTVVLRTIEKKPRKIYKISNLHLSSGTSNRIVNA